MDHVHQETKVSIGPVSGEFAPGFQVEGHSRFGSEYDNEVAHMSDESKKAAVVFGLKLTLTDESAGPLAVETLNQLKELASGVDQVKSVLDKGLTIDFRHEANKVFINVVVPENLEEFQGFPIEKVNLAGVNFSGKGDFKITSGVDPIKFIDGSLDNIVEMASNFSVEAAGNFEEIHHVLSAVSELIKEVGGESKRLKRIALLAPILSAFRFFGFNFKYDPTIIREVVRGLITGSGKEEKVTGQLSGNQEMAQQFLPQAQMMAPMFIGPYSDLLKNVNLGHYELFLMVPRLRLYLNPGFTFFSLNSFINEKFLN